MARGNSFVSRIGNMKRMVAALIMYTMENPQKEEEINCFFITNDFLVEESISKIKRNKNVSLCFKQANFETLFDAIKAQLTFTLNMFIEPVPFKDRLQREKNRKLIAFCKKTFKNEPDYQKLCNFTVKTYIYL